MRLNLYLQGHEGRFSIYVHASREKPVHVSPLFVDRDIQSGKVLEILSSPGLIHLERMRRWMNVRVEVQLGWVKFLYVMQWFSMKRRHALIVLADNLYYTKFKLYCKVNTYLLVLL
ncbi:hypothetical protein B296_00047780 [Ensete ventricosum]|uniref:Uncharacterized protein n=1 Tax=Ensete ventricosum TaxID=4639 RepID=A0A426YXU6_ENSVE|nr:hypothetical protein B296_00047780 [Ensete ventricosum]